MNRTIMRLLGVRYAKKIVDKVVGNIALMNAQIQGKMTVINSIGAGR